MNTMNKILNFEISKLILYTVFKQYIGRRSYEIPLMCRNIFTEVITIIFYTSFQLKKL